MNKERLIAFTDAVLAIVITILVLELEKPTQVSWAGIFALRENYFAYTTSFFWIGLMWLSHHNGWQKVKQINSSIVILSLLMLFFASFFPYTTSIMASNFNNSVAQALYGINVLLVTFCNIAISQALNRANHHLHFGLLFTTPNWAMILNILIKFVGLVITLTIYPPMMTWVVMFDVALLSVIMWVTSKNGQTI
ncbi:TMEM175 family protein [Companilactobacillus ginsenosidimutans]|uniref:Membrane protein n=1 Tax=Companilactobacillus ginsenosidimutans TaxID=1007676 RepID=A0A0H4QGP5_9LACO|nr:TMEM175 family protein [Companilactobacillus ginsenosidimutans]AKP67579.1 membrane protein [Companilactobacillus ginsenosidimutans]